MTVLTRLLLAVAAALPLMLGLPALAQMSLEQARAAGLVGERPDGLLGVVKGSPEAEALVAGVNARRQAEYREIAKRNGTSPEAVAKVAGERLVSRAPSGTFVMDPSGRWQKK